MDDILNVLIVEDEKPIREDLAMFPWDECGAILIGEAANGKEALEACSDVVPDVIVTDITMPGMDGLELMEEVQERYPDTVFIVLTCHADFDYARKALRLGAVDYVTKVALKDEDLKEAFDKARDRLNVKRRLKGSVWREEYWDRTSRFRAFLAGSELLPPFVMLPSRFVAIHYVCQRTDAIFVNRYCQGYLEREKEPVWFSPGGTRYIRLVSPVEDEGDALLRSFVVSLVRDLQEQAESAMPYLGGEVRFFGSYSEVVDSSDKLKAAVGLLDVYRDHAFYDERRLVFSGGFAPLPPLDDLLRDELDLELQRAEQSIDSLSSYLNNGLLIWGRRNRIKPDHLKSVLISRRELWKQRLVEGTPDDRFWMRLSGVSRLSEISHLLSREVEKTGSDEGRAGSMRQELVTARKIIKQEYSGSLTLSSVAARVGLSPSYLSRLFSAENGRSFKEFLTEVRMAKAMELLRTSGIKVYEVAEAVGVPSYRHFSSIFKGMTGVRPKDFQKGRTG